MPNEKMPVKNESKLSSQDYVAPAVEDVVTPERLGREVQYAGFTTPITTK